MRTELLTDDAVLFVEQRGAVGDAGLLPSRPGRAGPGRLSGRGHEGGGGGGVLRGRLSGRVLCRRRRLRAGRVPFCQEGVGVGRLRRAVHERGHHGVLVVAPGDLTHRAAGNHNVILHRTFSSYHCYVLI